MTFSRASKWLLRQQHAKKIHLSRLHLSLLNIATALTYQNLSTYIFRSDLSKGLSKGQLRLLVFATLLLPKRPTSSCEHCKVNIYSRQAQCLERCPRHLLSHCLVCTALGTLNDYSTLITDTVVANNFWGKDDAGVAPLLDRMHSAKVTSDELKIFYNSQSCQKSSQGHNS